MTPAGTRKEQCVGASTAASQRFAEIVDLSDVAGDLANLVARLDRGGRIVVRHHGQPIAALLPIAEVARLDALDATWEKDFAVLNEIGAAFRGVDPEEIERETAQAVAEVRAEMRADRAARGKE